MEDVLDKWLNKWLNAQKTRKEIQIELLRRQGRLEWDECQDCDYIGYGGPTTYHWLRHPGHRVHHVVDVPKQTTAETVHVVAVNNVIVGIYKDYDAARLSADVIMNPAIGREWRMLSRDVWAHESHLMLAIEAHHVQ